MPMLGQVRYIPNPVHRTTKKLKNDEPVTVPDFIVKETNEICSNKEEYDRKVYVYSRPVWSCRITGKSGITLSQAKKSESQAQKVINESFSPVLQGILLKQIHSSELTLDQMCSKCYSIVNTEYYSGEMIKLLQKNSTGNKYVDAKILSTNEIPIEKNDQLNCSADGSDKENSNSKKIVQKTNMRYDIEILGEEPKFVQSVTPDLISRPVKSYTKDLIRQFIRCYSLKYMPQFSGPWIVDIHLIKKFKIPSKPELEIDKDKLFEAYKISEIDIYQKCLKHELKASQDSSTTSKISNLKPRSSISVFKKSPPTSPSKVAKRPSVPANSNNNEGDSGESKTKQWRQSSILQFSPSRNGTDIQRKTPSPKKFKPPPEAIKLMNKLKESKSITLNEAMNLAKKIVLSMNETDFSNLDDSIQPYISAAKLNLELKPRQDKYSDNLLKDLPLMTKMHPLTCIPLSNSMSYEMYSRIVTIAEFHQLFICLHTSWHTHHLAINSQVITYLNPASWDCNSKTTSDLSDESYFSSSNKINPISLSHVPKIGLELLTEAIGKESHKLTSSYLRCIIRFIYAMLLAMKKYSTLKVSYLGFTLDELHLNPYTAVEIVKILMTQQYDPPPAYYQLRHKSDSNNSAKDEDENEDDPLTEDEEDEEELFLDDDASQASYSSKTQPKALKTKKEIPGILQALRKYDLDQISAELRIELLEFIMNEVLQSNIVNHAISCVESEAYKLRAKVRDLRDVVSNLNFELESIDKPVTNEKKQEDEPEGTATNSTSDDNHSTSSKPRLSLRQVDSIKQEEERKRSKQIQKIEGQLLTETNKLNREQAHLTKLENYLKAVTRIRPFGKDRNNAEYFYLKSAPERILIRVPEADDKLKIDLTAGEDQTSTETKYTWKMINTINDLEKLTESLCSLGAEESSLSDKLQDVNLIETISDAISSRDSELLREQKEGRSLRNQSNDWSKLAFESLASVIINNIIDMESRIRQSGLGGVEDYPALEDRIMQLEKKIDSRNFTEITDEKEAITKLNETREIVLVEIKEIIFEIFEALNKSFIKVPQYGYTKIDSSTPVEKSRITKKYETWLRKWKNGVESATSFSHVYFLLSVLYSAVSWDKSIESSKCQKCSKTQNEDKMLLCDRCNDPYHTYCLKPPMKNIPEGDWFCSNCIKRSTRLQTLVKNKQEEEQEDDPELVSELLMRDRKCLVCLGEYIDKEDEDCEEFVTCSTCPAIFHPNCHKPPLNRSLRRNTNWNCITCKNTGPKFLNSFSRLAARYSSEQARKKFFDRRHNDFVDKFGLEKPSRKSIRNRSSNGSANSETLSEEEIPPPKRTRTSLRSETQPVLNDKADLLKLHDSITTHRSAWPFLEPVDRKEAPDYYEVILDPIYLGDIKKKINDDPKYKHKHFSADISKMFYNAELYNPTDSDVLTASRKLERYIKVLFAAHKPPIEYTREKLN